MRRINSDFTTKYIIRMINKSFLWKTCFWKAYMYILCNIICLFIGWLIRETTRLKFRRSNLNRPYPIKRYLADSLTNRTLLYNCCAKVSKTVYKWWMQNRRLSFTGILFFFLARSFMQVALLHCVCILCEMWTDRVPYRWISDKDQMDFLVSKWNKFQLALLLLQFLYMYGLSVGAKIGT